MNLQQLSAVRRVLAPIAIAAAFATALSGCAGGTSTDTQENAKATADLPVIDGSISVKATDGRTKATVKSDADESELMDSVVKELESGDYTVTGRSKGDAGTVTAGDDKSVVTVTVKPPKVTYLFVDR